MQESGQDLGRRAREDELRHLRPDLVRNRGRLSTVRDDLLPGGARDANLEAVADALEAAGVRYGLVPDSELRHRVAIAPGDRDAALEACARAFDGLPVYARILGLGDGRRREVLAESLPAAVEGEETGLADEDGARVRGVRIFRPVVTTGRSLAYGPESGCDLEFWTAADSGASAALRATPYGWWVPDLQATSTIRVGARDYPLVDVFDARFSDDVDFPVDAVITWVDGGDPAWRRRRDLAAGTTNGPVDQDVNRYRDRGELRYCLRSLAAYAPWIRHIFIVTDDQVPAWLATDHPQVTVVDHREIFADPADLPVFNSHAIEANLHRIPGLAEHFLYLNDDTFLGRPQRPQDYFLASGLPQVFHDRRAVEPRPPRAEDDVYTASQKTTRDALERAIGRTYTHVLAHTPHPLRVSLFRRLEERLPDSLRATSRSTFRSAHDLAPVTLALHLALAEGRAVEGELEHAYAGTGRREQVDRLPDLAARRAIDSFCLGDDGGTDLSVEAQGEAIVTFLEKYFPVPSPYERQQPAG
ncbi:stealth conserved region 3 domain-containing protein [Marmoricola sp. RAF53]|uniref:stealth family protein n=1 Tax=Marmoricola sp. RAF53 TaxID=3233059 RepID=UPI003F97D693